MDPSFRLEVEDTDYYGPSSASRSRGGSVSSLADKAYNDPGIERAHALKGWNCAEVISFTCISYPKTTFLLDEFSLTKSLV